MLYNLIRKSSGNSFMFGHRGPWQLRPDGTLKSAMTICAKDSGIIMDEARLYNFPCPLTSATEQVMNMAIAAGLSKVDDGCISLLWEKYFGVGKIAEEGTEEEEEEKAKELSVKSSGSPKKVLFVGLGMMGAPMALAVQKAGIETVGLDISKEAMEGYAKAGGKAVTDIAQDGGDADVVVLVTNTAAEAGVVLFAVEGGLASGESNCNMIDGGADEQHSQRTQQSSYHQQSRPLPLGLSKSNLTP
jgi:3-hydroxyisobutyrate dehydrogenase-like beta-hydroxyacid dehydrogenase